VALNCPLFEPSFTVPTPNRLLQEHAIRHQAIHDFAGFSQIGTAADIIGYGFAMHGEFSHKCGAGARLQFGPDAFQDDSPLFMCSADTPHRSGTERLWRCRTS
jgi:hypothetical protein